eukprot:Clim_evm38s6 gene=Clim_evmTU38s6
MPNYVLSIDQGTSSTRTIVFEAGRAEIITSSQVEEQQITPQEGWVEMDPLAIMDSVNKTMVSAVEKLREKMPDLDVEEDLKAIGITNQRETTVVWNRKTGKPYHNAIVWLDGRTSETVEKLQARVGGDMYHFQKTNGLPFSTYFSAFKIRWLMDNVRGVAEAIARGEALMGTIDSWVVWNLTGGPDGGSYVTDVSNASRYFLMNLGTLQWDPNICRFFGIEPFSLPRICSSSEVVGAIMHGPLRGTKVCGILGDQQAALVGHGCLEEGSAKNTYGTGCFLLYNTGETEVISRHGLLTTVAYKLGPRAKPVYALEGAIAIAGAATRWLRDKLKLIEDLKDVETAARRVDNSGDVYFVPAFNGLFAPHWRMDARGVMCGITQYTQKEHMCRAVLEAICFQTCEIIDAMRSDCGYQPTTLRVDGGMSANKLMMQIQSDFLGIKVTKPDMEEMTALGAAMVAGNAMGLWNLDGTRRDYTQRMFEPHMDAAMVDEKKEKWSMAVERSLGWHRTETSEPARPLPTGRRSSFSDIQDVIALRLPLTSLSILGLGIILGYSLRKFT